MSVFRDRNHERARRGPDFTAPVMTRLGYEFVPTPALRRRRRCRLAGRLVVVLLLGGFVALGMDRHARSDVARRPVGVTIPRALGEELETHQQRLERVIRSIRAIRVIDDDAPAAPAAPQIDEDIDRSGLGPMRWL